MAEAKTTINDNLGNVGTDFVYNGPAYSTGTKIEVSEEKGNGGDIARGGIPSNVTSDRNFEIFNANTEIGSTTDSAKINEGEPSPNFVNSYGNQAVLAR